MPQTLTNLLNIKKKTHANQRLEELDVLRGFAVLFVVFFHLTVNLHRLNLSPRFGMVAVDLLFLISGFVIPLTTEKMGSAKEFLVKRAIRIFPTYWTCLTISTILLLVFRLETGTITTAIKYLANLSLFNLIFSIDYIENTYWSLTIEIIFYFQFALLIGFKLVDHLEKIFMGILFLITFVSLVFHFFPFPPSWQSSLLLIYSFSGMPFLPVFISGTIFYRIAKFGFTPTRISILIFAYVLLVYIRTLVLYPNEAPNILYIVSLTCCYLIFLGVITNKLSFIKNKFLIFIADISFPLYLIHMRISISVIMPFFEPKIGYWPAFFLNFGIIILAALLINRTIEKPSRKFLLKYVSKNFDKKT